MGTTNNNPGEVYGAKPYVARKVDIFTIGALAFFLIGGRRPFGGTGRNGPLPEMNALNRTDLQGAASIKAVAGTQEFWDRHLWISQDRISLDQPEGNPRICDFGYRNSLARNPYIRRATQTCFDLLSKPAEFQVKAQAEVEARRLETLAKEKAAAGKKGPNSCGGSLGGGGDDSSAWSFSSSDVAMPPPHGDLGGPMLTSASLSDGGGSFCGGYADTFEEERVVVLGNTCIMPAPDGWNLDRLAEHLRGMPGVAVRAGDGDFVEGEVEVADDDMEAASWVPANLGFAVAHDVAAATFKFVRHTGERMDLAELVYEVDAAVSA